MNVYITGIGAVSPIGMTARESFSAAAAGKSGITAPELFSQEITQIFERLFLEIRHDLNEPLSRLDEEAARIASLAEEARLLSVSAESL